MKLPSWLTRRASTSAEHLERAEEAERDLIALGHAKADAEAAYDADPSTSSESALIAADDALRRGGLRVESCRRAYAAAQERETAEARRIAQARIAEIEQLIGLRAVLAAAAPLDEREAALLLQLASVRVERHALNGKLVELGREHERLQMQLHGVQPVGIVVGDDGIARTTAPLGFQYRMVVASGDRIAEKLIASLQRLDLDDPRRIALAEVIAALGSDVDDAARHLAALPMTPVAPVVDLQEAV